MINITLIILAMSILAVLAFAATKHRLKPQASGTEVTWAMTAQSPYFAKVISVFINMDKMIGGDFEVGLRRLKALAEKTKRRQ